jgi:hypothetical protein
LVVGLSSARRLGEFGYTAANAAQSLGNMRELGVQNLIAYGLNDACRHTALIDVS